MDKLTKEVLKNIIYYNPGHLFVREDHNPFLKWRKNPELFSTQTTSLDFCLFIKKNKFDSFSSGSWKHLQELSLSEWFSSKNVNLPWRWKQLLIYVSFQRWEKCLGSWFGSVMSSQRMRYGQQQDKLHTGYACNSCFHTNVCEMLKQLAKQVLCWSCTVIQKHATLPLWQTSIHCLWLSCCCFHLLTLCYNSTNSCLWNI